MVHQITLGQVKQIALEVSKRWKFVNHGSYYNCVDTKTKQSSNQGGNYNFASYNFWCKVELMYLAFIGENSLYFDWQLNGVDVSNNRKIYVYKITEEVVKMLCGFEIKE
jgi:hypothetical protein